MDVIRNSSINIIVHVDLVLEMVEQLVLVVDLLLTTDITLIEIRMREFELVTRKIALHIAETSGSLLKGKNWLFASKDHVRPVSCIIPVLVLEMVEQSVLVADLLLITHITLIEIGIRTMLHPLHHMDSMLLCLRVNMMFITNHFRGVFTLCCQRKTRW